jgi:transposase
MKNENNKPTTILAIDPTIRGFGFIVFEGVKNPLDWGKPEMRIQKNRRCLDRITKLVIIYQQIWSTWG